MLEGRKFERFNFTHLHYKPQMSEDYQTIYGVGLLDDIHNYFPRLLYNSDEFTSVQSIMIYVQDRMQQRFNLFNHGRRQYMNTIPRTPPENTIRFSVGENQNPLVSTILPLLQRLATPRVVRVPMTTQFQDVIVHASQEVINGASREVTLEEDREDCCNICQDNMRQGESIRTLVCSHSYHRSCIDNWLLNQSVLCPTCRHDIRDPYTVPASRRVSPALGPSTAPTASETPVTSPNENAVPDTFVLTPPRTPLISTTDTRVQELRNLLTQDIWNAIYFPY
jgi:hypothetical protein